MKANAERLLVGAVLFNSSLLARAQCLPHHFEDPSLGRLWRSLSARPELSIPERAADAGAPVEAVSALRGLALEQGVARQVPELSKAVVDSHLKRQVVGELKQLLSESGGLGPLELLARGQQALAKAGAGAPQQFRDVGHFAKVLFEELSGKSVAPKAIPTGVPALDARLAAGGLRRGGMHVIAGETGSGKSSLALWVAQHAASLGERSAILTLEDDEDTLLCRMLAQRTHIITARLMQRRGVDMVDNAQARKAASELAGRVSIKSGVASLDELMFHLTRAAIDGVSLAIVDYVQLLPREGASEYDSLTQASNMLARLARSTGLALIACSQMNRSRGEGLSVNRLRGSGAIGQDCYTAIVIDGDERFDAHGKKQRIPARRVRIAKQKNGPRADVVLKFVGRCSLWGDATEELVERWRKGDVEAV